MMSRSGLLLAVALCLAVVPAIELFSNKSAGKKFDKNFGADYIDKCFCKLKEDVDDCECTIESIDKLNNYRIHPMLDMLVEKDYFRYIKVNLNKICQFWHDDARCSLKDCHVKMCTEDDLPKELKDLFENENQHRLNADKQYNNNIKRNNDLDTTRISQNIPKENFNDCEQSNPLGQLNTSLTEENLKTFEDWRKYDDSRDNFCEPDDELLAKAEYADLVINPERFTGYKAPHAHKIWNSIYRENCFDEQSMVPVYGQAPESCLEKRIFYRLISGLHTSINIHLCSRFLHKGILDQPDRWGPNPEEFKYRFDPETTGGQGPQWLKNLYFLYLVELRAIAKAAPYFEKETFYAGRSQEDDHDTKMAVLDLLNATKSFKNHFDESILFKGNTENNMLLKEQLQLKFRNITKIMDCVGCDKCRLWGKVQTLALGTALKILISGKSMGLDSTVNADSKQTFHLSRSEIVALFNGFARLSNSIAEIENFKELLPKQSNGQANGKNFIDDL